MNYAAAIIWSGGPLLVLAAVIAWDRWREPRRDPSGPMAVVDRRTLRDALRRVDRLDPVTGRPAAVGHLTAARIWLRGEIHTGPKRRRAWAAGQLRQVEIKLLELGAPPGLYS
jgi:hypothetical protein